MASVPSEGCRYGGWWCQNVGDQEEAGDPTHGGDEDWRDSDGDDDPEVGVHEDDHDDDWRLKMVGDQ